jgi:hypothetical protein
MAPTRLEVTQRGLDKEFPLSAIDESVRPQDGHTVAELLPDGYARYLRIFHPVLPADARYLKQTGPMATRTWQSIADEVGAVYHPELMFIDILDDIGGTGRGSAPYPSEGRLDEPARSALFGLLGATGAGDAYFLYYLTGMILAHGPLLFQAPLGEHAEVHAAASELFGEGPDSAPGPEFIWPSDRSWVVTTDCDLHSTYVACDEALAEQILGAAQIEALPVSRATRVDWYADQINGAPDQTAPTAFGDTGER